MKKITLVFKGDALVMVYGKGDWKREMERKPECTWMYIGMTKLKNVEYEGKEIFGETIDCYSTDNIDWIYGGNADGKYLIEMTVVKDVKLPVTFEVEDFDTEKLMLHKNWLTDFWNVDEITSFTKNKLDDIRGVMDERTVRDILAHDELYGDNIDKLSNKIG